MLQSQCGSQVYTFNVHSQCKSLVLCLDLPRTRPLQSVESAKAVYTSQAPTTVRGVRIRKVSRTTSHAAKHIVCDLWCMQYMRGASSCGFINTFRQQLQRAKMPDVQLSSTN